MLRSRYELSRYNAKAQILQLAGADAFRIQAAVRTIRVRDQRESAAKVRMKREK
jgi:hypothetical protein